MLLFDKKNQVDMPKSKLVSPTYALISETTKENEMELKK